MAIFFKTNPRARVKTCFFFFLEFSDLRYCNITSEYSYQHCLLRFCKNFCRAPNLVPHIATPSLHTQRLATIKKGSQVTYVIFFSAQNIRQKIENLVFLFEIRSNLLNKCGNKCHVQYIGLFCLKKIHLNIEQDKRILHAPQS